MIQKIKITDPIQARACIQWLIEEIGPVTVSNGGPCITAEGWFAYVMPVDNGPDVTTMITVNDHVDTDTQLLFALKWS